MAVTSPPHSVATPRNGFSAPVLICMRHFCLGRTVASYKGSVQRQTVWPRAGVTGNTVKLWQARLKLWNKTSTATLPYPDQTGLSQTQTARRDVARA